MIMEINCVDLQKDEIRTLMEAINRSIFGTDGGAYKAWDTKAAPNSLTVYLERVD